MTGYDFSPLFRSAIGFDRIARALDDAARVEQTGYPPYNVELVEENRYEITMALAGFERDELNLEFEGDSLKVVGRKARQEQKRTYLHRGIAERDFEHRFKLADHVSVTGANLINGILRIDLVRQIPEALKARRIEIGVADQSAEQPKLADAKVTV